MNIHIMKKTISIVLTLVLILGMAVPAMAQMTRPTDSAIGYIVEVNDDVITIRGAWTGHVFRLRVSDETLIIDAVDGTPATLQDRRSDRVKLYWTSRAMAMSDAVVIAINLPEGSTSTWDMSPHYYVVEEVEFIDEDTLLISVDWGMLEITLERDASSIPLEFIAPGAAMLFWYDEVVRGFPRQAHAYRSMFLHHGQPVPGTGIMYDDTEFFPVRALAEANEFSATWHHNKAVLESLWFFSEFSTAHTITIAPDEVAVSASFTVIDRATNEARRSILDFEMSRPPIIIESRLFAPADFFEALVYEHF
ncbi:MAG: hypothetical protein FWB91_08055 [Defluviitaleaceae bacterium]|nr:hypothetical protein [Defluviitaleaceae bacterium]